MRIEYTGVCDLNGPLLTVEGVRGVAYDEMAEIVTKDGQVRSGRVIMIDGDRAVLQAEVRGATAEVNEYVEQYARRIAENAAAMHGCTCRVIRAGAAEGLRSDPAMIRLCQQVGRERLGFQVAELPAGASEDYACMVNRVRSRGGRGLYFKTLSPCSGPLHSRTFDFREDDLANGTAMFCALAYSLQHEGPIAD